MTDSDAKHVLAQLYVKHRPQQSSVSRFLKADFYTATANIAAPAAAGTLASPYQAVSNNPTGVELMGPFGGSIPLDMKNDTFQIGYQRDVSAFLAGGSVVPSVRIHAVGYFLTRAEQDAVNTTRLQTCTATNQKAAEDRRGFTMLNMFWKQYFGRRG